MPLALPLLHLPLSLLPLAVLLVLSLPLHLPIALSHPYLSLALAVLPLPLGLPLRMHQSLPLRWSLALAALLPCHKRLLLRLLLRQQRLLLQHRRQLVKRERIKKCALLVRRLFPNNLRTHGSGRRSGCGARRLYARLRPPRRSCRRPCPTAVVLP